VTDSMELDERHLLAAFFFLARLSNQPRRKSFFLFTSRRPDGAISNP